MNFRNHMLMLPIGLLVLLSLCVAGFSGIAESEEPAAPGPAPSSLEGKWFRPDGGYELKLSAPGPAGSLTAAYFNPRPIHVEHAEWKHEDGMLQVFVKLQAPNYPGSTYTLTYQPNRDVLVGIYYQALHRQSFNVEFKRELQ